MRCLYIPIFFGVACCYPSSWVQKIAGNQEVFNESNSLEKFDDDFSDLDIYFKGNLTKANNYTKTIIPFSTEFSDKNKTLTGNATTISGQSPSTSEAADLDPVAQKNYNANNSSKNPKREETDGVKEKESQEEESSEEEEGGNMLTGLLSAFLSGLSRPDGSIDLEAIVGLLGSLSMQNPDGTYDFTGLTELLRSFFGGGDGGSDIGAFVGGLLGAVIKGVANPPGPKGAGILAGKVVTGVLPALSAPVPMDNKTNPWQKEPQLDSGSFLTGFLKTSLGGGGNGQGGRGSKYTLFKLLFSALTGVISAASSLSSKSDWN